MRDSKGRFKSKELLLPLPSTTMVLNIIFLIIILLPLLYVFLKFNILERINALLNSLFFIIPNAIEIILLTEKINIKKRQN